MFRSGTEKNNHNTKKYYLIQGRVSDLAAYVNKHKEWTRYNKNLDSGFKTVQLPGGSFSLKKALATCRIDGRLYWNMHNFGYRILDAHLLKTRLTDWFSWSHLAEADIRFSMEWLDSTFNFCISINLSALIFVVSNWFSTCLFHMKSERYYLVLQ